MANFSKQAAISMRSGLTVTRAFPLIARESKDRRLKRTLQEINADIARGSSLTETFRSRAKLFPPIFVEMVEAGERTGHLDKVFSNLASYFDTRLMLRRAAIRASVYPMLQLTMAYAVFSLIMILFSANKMAMAYTLAYSSIAVVVSIVGIRFLFRNTATGRAIWDRMLLSVPLMRSVTLKLCMARFSRSLAMQLDSGISMAEAIERAASVTGNGAVAKNLRRTAEPIRRGASLAEAIGTSRIITPMVREVLAIGEETGNFTESLERVADIYEEESLVVLESLPKFIGPVVVVIVGIVVAYLLYTVYYVHYIKPSLDMLGM